jgi:peroxiredoxin
MKLKENETIPNSEFFIMEDGNPVKKNTFEFFKDKRAVLFGLPGAYTSVCSAKHLPGYVDSHDEYKAKGVDLIVCI